MDQVIVDVLAVMMTISKLEDHNTDIILAAVHLGIFDESGSHSIRLLDSLAQFHHFLVLAYVPQPVRSDH